MAEPLLSVLSINKRFGAVQASSDFSLEVARGELHALIGPNGAGKTTALNQLCGETMPDSGRIYFDGKQITRMPAYRRAQLGMARSYQITSVFDHLTVRENLSLAIQAHHGHSFRFWKKAASDPVVHRAVLPAMARVDLEARADAPAASLSHGEKRQLEVGMALSGGAEAAASGRALCRHGARWDRGIDPLDSTAEKGGHHPVGGTRHGGGLPSGRPHYRAGLRPGHCQRNTR
jgi:branched-chain amino acid transport system ATP-binding protein